MWGDNALRFGWLTTCWGSVVAGGRRRVVATDVVVVVDTVVDGADAAADVVATGTIRLQSVATAARAMFPQRSAHG